MATSGDGIFDDGTTSGSRAVAVALEPLALTIRSVPDGGTLARWPYGEIERVPAPTDVLRVARRRQKLAARLEIREPQFAAALGELLDAARRHAAAERRGRLTIAGLSVAAAVWLILVAVFGLPLLAERIAPILPAAVERKLGEQLDGELRATLDTRRLGAAFECAKGEATNPSRRALDKLVGRLAAAADLAVPLRTSVLRRNEANAFALPGGYIYLFEGLIAKAVSPDELAGVIAHELGHVAHRDGTRAVLQAAGLSFLFGALFRDFVGGGAITLAGKAVLQSAYSREVEAAADRYAVDLMAKAGGDARAFGAVLERISGAIEPAAEILADHPLTRTRVAAVNAAAAPPSGKPLLDPAEWAALKKICGGR